jgi:hypothetical protein
MHTGTNIQQKYRHSHRKKGLRCNFTGFNDFAHLSANRECSSANTTSALPHEAGERIINQRARKRGQSLPIFFALYHRFLIVGGSNKANNLKIRVSPEHTKLTSQERVVGDVNASMKSCLVSLVL